MKNFKSLFLVIILLSGNLFPQTFTASVDNTTIGLNEQFQLTFTFEGQDINGVRNFTPPALSKFLVLSGPNQSSSMQIINGAVSGSLSFSYILQSREMGDATIGEASVEYSGKVLKSAPLKITVVKASQKPKQNDNPVSTKEIADNLFIRAFVDKRKVYLGEQVTVTYKLYTRLNIAAQMSINKLPQYQGFWAEELETSSNITFSTEVINGKQFRVGTLKKAALFPTQAGKLEITPFELTVPIQIKKTRNRNNFFDDFFNDPFGVSQTVEYNATSNKVTINVQPLPLDGKPDSFNGAVGEFSMNADIDKTNAKTNEPVNLKVVINGNGNLKLLEIPKLNLPSGFEKYEPKTSENINRRDIISGRKTAEYLMVPRIVGRREIPAVDVSYFSPAKKKFVTLKSGPFTLKITQGERLAEVDYPGKEDIRQLGDDIRFIKTSNDDITRKEESVLFTTFFWVGGIAPMLILFVLFVCKKKYYTLACNLLFLRYLR